MTLARRLAALEARRPRQPCRDRPDFSTFSTAALDDAGDLLHRQDRGELTREEELRLAGLALMSRPWLPRGAEEEAAVAAVQEFAREEDLRLADRLEAELDQRPGIAMLKINPRLSGDRPADWPHPEAAARIVASLERWLERGEERFASNARWIIGKLRAEG